MSPTKERPTPELKVLDAVTGAFALTFLKVPRLLGLMIGPLLAGTAVLVVLEAFIREQTGLPFPDALKDLVWAPFSAAATIALFRYFEGKLSEDGWLHLEWPPCAPAVTFVLAVWFLSSLALDELLRLVQLWIANAVTDPNTSMHSASHEAEQQQATRYFYAALGAKSMVEGAMTIALLGLIPIAIATGRLDLNANFRLMGSRPVTVFMIVMFCGMVFAAIDQVHIWAFSKLHIGAYSYWDPSSTWRENVNDLVLYHTLWFPRNCFRFSMTACLLATIWMALSNQLHQPDPIAAP